MGNPVATVEDVRIYYNNLINYVKGGTPRKPGQVLETYLFPMFDENQKSRLEIEKYFDLFTSIQQPKYQVDSIKPCSDWITIIQYQHLISSSSLVI